MKKSYLLYLLSLTILLFGSGSSKLQAQVSFGDAQKFNKGWLFTLGDENSAKEVDFSDSKWQNVDLPHDWTIEGELSTTLSSCTGYLPGGIGWYRKHFTIDNQQPNQYIYFEGVYNRSEVYINGHLLGKRPNGYVSFMYDITPYINRTGENIIAVRVDHSLSADSRWYTGSGIYRDVWLVSAAEVHIAQWGVAYRAEEFKGSSAKIAVDVAIDNKIGTSDRLDIYVELKDKEGNVVGKATTKAVSAVKGIDKKTLYFTVKNAQRWSLEEPYLYTLRCEVKQDGKVVDSTEIAAGIRELTFDANKGFALNGKWTNIKGVCLHHDAGVLGAAVPEEVWRVRLTKLKELGVNGIRMSHNPQAPIVYQICDEIGLLVKDEAFDEWENPKRKWINGWNKGISGFEGSYDFFDEWCERDVKDMVRRNRNHPSIFMWSIGNEVDYPNDPYSHPILDGSKISQPMYGGYDESAPKAEDLGRISKRLADYVRSEDSSRPVTAALAGVVMSNETDYPANLDVVGYNYTESRYEIDHEKYPNRIIYGSENGASYEAWKHVRDKEYIFAQFLWTGADYLGEAGLWPSRGAKNGLIDVANQIKPRGHFRESLWSDKPVTYIGTYPYIDRCSIDAWDVWNYEDGELIRVVCYTNSPKAQLLLNGEVVGQMKEFDEQVGMIWWDIPYRSGELKAEGFDSDGNTESQYSITSSHLPYALRVTSDKTQIDSDGSIAQLTIEVVDEKGTVVKLADNAITCTVEGCGELLGLESGDIADISSYRDNTHRVFYGRIVSYIQSTEQKGDIKVKFTSPLLKGCEIVIESK